MCKNHKYILIMNHLLFNKLRLFYLLVFYFYDYAYFLRTQLFFNFESWNADKGTTCETSPQIH